MSGVCSTHGERQIHTNLSENMKGRGNSEDLGVDGKTISE